MDLEAAAGPPRAAPPAAPGEAPPPWKPLQLELPGMPRRVVSFPVAGDPLQQAREIVAKSEREAVRQIAQRLSKTYLDEIDDLYREKRRALEPVRREELDALFREIRSRFEAYAKRRGPLLVALALLVGWPDPDPQSLLEPDPSNPRRLAAFKEAKALREKIQALDKRYDEGIRALFAAYQEGTDQAMADLMLEMEDLRAQKLRQAEEEARKQVESVRDQLHSLVVGDPSVTLESVPPKVVAFPSVSEAAPKPPERARSDARLQDAQADLEIWLAQNRYALAPKGRARDATKEFIAWRNKRTNGR